MSSSNEKQNSKGSLKDAPDAPATTGWFEESPKSGVPTDPDQIRAMLQHKPLAGRTSDPVAADFDKAAELFCNGVRLFRSGEDRTQGRDDIAAAFLLDSRSIKYIHKLPPHFTDELKHLCLDLDLIQELCEINTPGISQLPYSCHVLRVLAANKFGTMIPTMYAGAMHSILFLFQAVQKNPELEAKKTGPLHGYMTRPNLLYLQSTIFLATRSQQKAIQSLTAAIDLDPDCIRAREARASLWANLKAVDDKTLVAEYRWFVQKVHPDHRGNDVAFAWMALKILINSALGKLQEGNYFYTQAFKAWDRRNELYGGANNSMPQPPIPPILKLVKHQYTAMKNNYDAWTKREMLDNGESSDSSAITKVPTKKQWNNESQKNSLS